MTGPSSPPSSTPSSTPSSGPRRTSRLDPDELAGLEEQRDFLLRSIEDLDAELAAGDLDEADHRALRDDYTARAAEVLRAIADQHRAFEAARRPRSAARTTGVVVGLVVFALLAGWVVARSLGSRDAGDTITGGVDVKQSASQRAQACIPKIDPQAPSEAIDCFRAVLDDDPRNPVALTWLGWQVGLSAALVPPEQAVDLEASAADLVDRAVAVNPDYSYARAFRAVLAYRRGELELAQRYLEEFEANDPSPDARSVIESQDLAARIDAALAAQAGTTTSTTASTTATSAVTPSSSAPGGG